MQINTKYTTMVFGVVMGGFTSFVISAVLTFVNNGMSDFFLHWIKNWMVALCLAIPIATFLPPIVRREIAKITEEC